MEAITKYSFEAICKAGFSHEAKLLEKGIASEDEPPFCQAFTYCFEKQKSRVFRLQFFNKIPTWGNIKFWNALDRLHSSVDDLIDESERHSNKKDNERVDLLSLMMKAKHPDTGETLDRKNLRDQAITLLVAGHKTVQLLTSWFMYLLSQNPDVETKVVDELFEILGDGTLSTTYPDPETCF
jgi:cytochrome P450/NADPH-cytochrome P450 reductase